MNAQTENMTPEQYCDEHGVWSAYPGYPVEDWRAEVANENTKQGYWGWVESEQESRGDD